ISKRSASEKRVASRLADAKHTNIDAAARMLAPASSASWVAVRSRPYSAGSQRTDSSIISGIRAGLARSSARCSGCCARKCKVPLKQLPKAALGPRQQALNIAAVQVDHKQRRQPDEQRIGQRHASGEVEYGTSNNLHCGGGERRDRRDARDRERKRPRANAEWHQQRGDRQQYASAGGHGFAALEVQKDRKRVAE